MPGLAAFGDRSPQKAISEKKSLDSRSDWLGAAGQHYDAQSVNICTLPIKTAIGPTGTFSCRVVADNTRPRSWNPLPVLFGLLQSFHQPVAGSVDLGGPFNREAGVGCVCCEGGARAREKKVLMGE